MGGVEWDWVGMDGDGWMDEGKDRSNELGRTLTCMTYDAHMWLLPS